MCREIFGTPIAKICTCAVLFLLLPSRVGAFSYSHDFSVDPGWTTNDPSWFYWNSLLGTYHLTTISDGSHKYTYVEIDWSGQSFMFSYDIMITQDGYGSGIWFGAYSTSMANYHDNNVVAHMGRDDGGHNIFLFTCASGIPTLSGINYGWLNNTWYTVTVNYDSPSNNAQMVVVHKATGDTISGLSSILGSTLSSLVKLGASSRYISVYGGIFQAEIDNVAFTWVDYFIQATIDVDPDVLNFRSQGEWVTCYIELPEDYSPYDIDANTIAISAINGESIEPFYRTGPTEIGDHDWDGIEDLMVKFDRQVLIDLLNQHIIPPANVELTVTGDMIGNEMFNGSDIMYVITPGGGP